MLVTVDDLFFAEVQAKLLFQAVDKVGISLDHAEGRLEVFPGKNEVAPRAVVAGPQNDEQVNRGSFCQFFVHVCVAGPAPRIVDVRGDDRLDGLLRLLPVRHPGAVPGLKVAPDLSTQFLGIRREGAAHAGGLPDRRFAELSHCSLEFRPEAIVIEQQVLIQDLDQLPNWLTREDLIAGEPGEFRLDVDHRILAAQHLENEQARRLDHQPLVLEDQTVPDHEQWLTILLRGQLLDNDVFAESGVVGVCHSVTSSVPSGQVSSGS